MKKTRNPKTPAVQEAPATRAFALKSDAPLPDHPLPDPTSDDGMRSKPKIGQAPSGAPDAQGQRPVLERSRKVR